MTQYPYLKDLDNLPRIVRIAVQLIGIHEVEGDGNNPQIMDWAKDLNLDYTNDDVAWCGLFVAHVVKLSGRTPIENPLWARNWMKWGQPVDKPMLGDILVFKRGTGGHVGIYIAEDRYTFYVLGGNQGNQVSIVRIVKERLLAARRPSYNVVPSTVKSYVVQADGKISSNEA